MEDNSSVAHQVKAVVTELTALGAQCPDASADDVRSAGCIVPSGKPEDRAFRPLCYGYWSCVGVHVLARARSG